MNTIALQPSECHLRSASVLLVLWIAAAILLSATGQLAESDYLMPVMITLPVAGFALAWKYKPGFRERVLAIDTGVLVIVHSWRMLGLGFLFLYAHGTLPGLFAWLAGIGDALAAIGATLIGIQLLRGNTVSEAVLRSWNRFGLLDFLVAIVIGTALRSRWLGEGVTTDAMAQLPLSLIPTLVVPFYLVIHVIIALQSRARQKA